MSAIHFIPAGRTDVGLKRAENEDTFALVPELRLFLLADGMGGHNSGKLASTMTVQLITEFYARHINESDVDWPYDPEPGLCFEANLLVNSIKYANERVFIEGCKNSDATGMGTTITALCQTDREIIIAHVGDSRIYRQRDGRLQQMTEDHSLANHMVRTGQLRPEDVPSFKRSNVIMRAIGLKDYVEVDVRVLEPRPHDIIMMCSDGLSDLVKDPLIQSTINAIPDLDAVCERLIQYALDEGGKDNITVVCLRAEPDPNAPPVLSRPQTSTPRAARPPTQTGLKRPRTGSGFARPLSGVAKRPDKYAPPPGVTAKGASSTLDLPVVGAAPTPAPEPSTLDLPVAPPMTLSGAAPVKNRRSRGVLLHAVRQPRMTLVEARTRVDSGELCPPPPLPRPRPQQASRPQTPPPVSAPMSGSSPVSAPMSGSSPVSAPMSGSSPVSAPTSGRRRGRSMSGSSPVRRDTIETMPALEPSQPTGGARNNRTTLRDLPAVPAPEGGDPYGAFPDPWKSSPDD